MRHRIFGKKLHRNTKQRIQLFRSLAVNFIQNDKLATSFAKAKAVRPFIEKLVTRAKDDSKFSRSYLSGKLNNQLALAKLVTVAKEMADRQSGYTKLLKTNPKVGDNSKQALLLWVKEFPAKILPDVKKTMEEPAKLSAPVVKKVREKKRLAKK
ncbi:50S ribosomal protein L17 [Candidatus Gottesmanbacteria bacterium]|nr:50S ribosomal protein L17 [Candidatus Gottesmanbacteria bacterium]